MRFFQRLGLGLATSIFSSFLVVFALSVSAFMVLDKPQTIKGALKDSGAYQVLVDNALAHKQQQLSAYLPVNNAEVQQAINDAFSTSYLQKTTDRNIDATYAWIHGETNKPQYSADLTEPKAALANNISRLVEQKLSKLPPCSGPTVLPTTVTDVLNMDCRPVGVSTQYLVAAAQQGIGESNVFDKVVAPVLTLQDEQGKSLTNSLSVVPKAYHYFVIALFVIPIVLIATGLAVIFWSESRRQGLKAVSRSLLITGIITILLALAVVWGLGKAVHLAADSSSDLLLIQSKIMDIARIVGIQLRNWLIGISGGYLLIALGLYLVTRLRQSTVAHQNEALNKSLGYNQTIPTAGTMFGGSTDSKELGERGKTEEEDKK